MLPQVDLYHEAGGRIKMTAALEEPTKQAEISLRRHQDGELLVVLSGIWRLESSLPSAKEVEKQIDAPQVQRIAFGTRDLKAWDSSLLTFLLKLRWLCEQRNIQMGREGLPEGVKRLIKLATAVPERKGARKEFTKERVLAVLGTKAIFFWASAVEMVDFLGEASAAFGRLLTGRAWFRRSDLVLLLEECGAQALPIVSLISVLVGLILAFVSAIQLEMFGAQIFVADVVGIGMVRIMGAIMAGIIMAGRTGAAFAAQIGTMQVNEEIDALQTLGISPMEFLVLPRMVALIIMMPLLCLYADVMGIVGGIVVGTTMLDLSLTEYLHQTREAVKMTYLWIGLFHSIVFGVLVALVGCLRGIQCGRSASAVGEAATSAVVTSIVAIVAATAVITFACQLLGI
jgi:phospholipid/cholesterol/gamma-HCH transport system permease protein